MRDKLEGAAPIAGTRETIPKTEKEKRSTAKPTRKAETPTIGDDLTGKFLRVGDRLYRTSGDRNPIVKLEPDRLKTRNIDALPDIIRLAKANGWTSIRIKGGDIFKKAAFLAAAAQGLNVEGYTPSRLVRAEAERLRARLDERAKRAEIAEHSGKSRRTNTNVEENQRLAARFLRQTDEQNARDPELKRAQTLVGQAASIANARFGDDAVGIAKAVSAKREEVAARIAGGDRIGTIQLRTQQSQIVRELDRDQTLHRTGRGH